MPFRHWTNWNRISTLFSFITVNCHLFALKRRLTPKVCNWFVYSPVKGTVLFLFLTVSVFGFYLTLAVILVCGLKYLNVCLETSWQKKKVTGKNNDSTVRAQRTVPLACSAVSCTRSHRLGLVAMLAKPRSDHVIALPVLNVQGSITTGRKGILYDTEIKLLVLGGLFH